MGLQLSWEYIRPLDNLALLTIRPQPVFGGLNMGL